MVEGPAFCRGPAAPSSSSQKPLRAPTPGAVWGVPVAVPVPCVRDFHCGGKECKLRHEQNPACVPQCSEPAVGAPVLTAVQPLPMAVGRWNAAAEGQEMPGKGQLSQILKLNYTLTFLPALAQNVIPVSETQWVWICSSLHFSMPLCSPFPIPWVSNAVSVLYVLTCPMNNQFNCHMHCSSRKKLLLPKGVKVSHV